MSLNYREENNNISEYDFYTQQKFDDNGGYYNIGKVFTNLQSCEPSNDTDSESSHLNSSDFDNDGDDDEKPMKIYFSSLTKQDVTESNEDFILEKSKTHEQNSCSYESDAAQSSNDIIDLIHKDLYKFIFMPISKQFINYVRCRLVRDKSGLSQTFRFEVECEDNGKSLCLLTAEKQVKISGQSQYIISVFSKFTDDVYSAELLSNNIAGTDYSLYFLNEDQRQQLAIILYETNFLGFNGPRKIEVLLPKFNDKMQPLIEENDIVEHNSTERSNSFIHLRNKPPIWNPHTCSYMLYSDGKVSAAIRSVKNFQMIIENEEHDEQIVMQFCRIADNEFSCYFRYPLSLIQTFGIALSALESRLFRQ